MSDDADADRPSLPDAPLSDAETLQSVRIAERYLGEVERVLWETAARTTDDDTAEALETLTQSVWSLQNGLADLESTLDAQTDAPEWAWEEQIEE